MLATLCHTPAPLTCPSAACITMATASLPRIPPRPAPQRPKLIINTQQPRIPGKAASLRVDLLSAASPTVRNTFSNTYDPAVATTTTTTTTAACDPATPTLPYKQPHHLVSILANSPVVPRKMVPARPRFPAEKRVSFRTPLEEHITTVKYTLAHSDLLSSCSTLASIASTQETQEAAASSGTTAPHPSNPTFHASLPGTALQIPIYLPQTPCHPLDPTDLATKSPLPPSPPRTGQKRDSSSSEDDSDSCPETPVAGRRKRTRDWRWTLGPLTSKPLPSNQDLASSEDST